LESRSSSYDAVGPCFVPGFFMPHRKLRYFPFMADRTYETMEFSVTVIDRPAPPHGTEMPSLRREIKVMRPFRVPFPFLKVAFHRRLFRLGFQQHLAHPLPAQIQPLSYLIVRQSMTFGGTRIAVTLPGMLLPRNTQPERVAGKERAGMERSASQ